MNDKTQEKHFIVDILFVLALFGVFAVSALSLVTIGADVYQHTVEDMSVNYDSRTAVSYIMEKVRQMTVPVLLLINKIDLTDQEKLVKLVEEWKELLPQAEIIPISAASKFNVDYVMKRIKELLPDSPPYFGKDQWTDKPARFFVNEIIREKILLYYDKEIPYSVEVVVEEFKEEPKKIHIRAVINVERDSQKGIIIGKQGKALKKVATEARRELERFFGKTIFLETYVKVDKDWRSSDKELRNFGYQLD